MSAPPVWVFGPDEWWYGGAIVRGPWGEFHVRDKEEALSLCAALNDALMLRKRIEDGPWFEHSSGVDAALPRGLPDGNYALVPLDDAEATP